MAKFCSASEDGENWIVECARAVDLRTGTSVQFVCEGLGLGVQGAIAT